MWIDKVSKFVVLLYMISKFFGDVLAETRESHVHPYGRPENVLRFSQNGSFIIDDEGLNRIFMHPEVKDRKIIAVSIIGAYRKGKSFLMDYALRYMYSHYKSIANPNNTLNSNNNWMGEPDEILVGFSWRGGVARDTAGVIIWSDVFLFEKEDEKYAIILLDTQGLFDTETSPTDNSRIFALGTLASSIQIFNLNDVIQENQLAYLHLATEFAQLAQIKSKSKRKSNRPYKPFQKLMFLIRDWQNSHEYEFGRDGGNSYLSSVLLEKPDQPEELQNVRKYIRSTFEKTDCFLMPHPGSTVVSDPLYQGERKGLSKEFEKHLGKFLSYILNAEELKAKKILNTEVTAEEYAAHLKAYFEAFESDEIPKVETLHQITVNKQYEILISEAFDIFKSNLKNIDYDSQNFIDEMTGNGNDSMKLAFSKFTSKTKIGNAGDEERYRKKLELLMQIHLDDWKGNYIKTREELDRMKKEGDDAILKLEEEAKRKLEEQERNATSEINQMKAEQKKIQDELIASINAAKTAAEEEMRVAREEHEAHKKKMEEDNKKLLEQVQKRNEEIKKISEEEQRKLQKEIDNLSMFMKNKEEEMVKIIADRDKTRLEEIKLQNKYKEMEMEMAVQISDKKRKAELDKSLFYLKMQIEELKEIAKSNSQKTSAYEAELEAARQQNRRYREMLMQRYSQ